MNRIFLDTNIIVYANDTRDRKRQKNAIKIIKDLMLQQSGVISTQVLQEYAYVANKKLQQSPDVVMRQLILLETFDVINQTPDQIRRAIELKHLYRIDFWDACIISNAETAACGTIYSEGLNTGQFYSGIKIVNPFI